MSAIAPIPHASAILPVENGDRLTRAEFERRCAMKPPRLKAELVDGVVYLETSFTECDFREPRRRVLDWLATYLAATPRLVGGQSSRVRLDGDNVVCPDAHLRLPKQVGGKADLDDDGYIAGPPELVCEVVGSSASYALRDKMDVYRRNGVREYIVWRIHDGALDWFVLRGAQYVALSAGGDGIVRSETFPGLWLDAALLRGDTAAVVEVLHLGIATPEHAAFIKRRAAAARS